jgi:hypothetical protein
LVIAQAWVSQDIVEQSNRESIPKTQASRNLSNGTRLHNLYKEPEMIRTKFAPPAAAEYAEYYDTYISRFQPADFMTAFEGQADELKQLFGNLSDGEDSKLHEPYTWTLKQLMGHLIDCERIFSTRLLRIAVNDSAPMPGIDQDVYVDNLDYETVTMSDLLDEFACLRRANVLLANRLTAESLENMGTASDAAVSAKANLFILGGHVVYHVEIAKRRLGLDV